MILILTIDQFAHRSISFHSNINTHVANVITRHWQGKGQAGPLIRKENIS